MTDAHGQHSHVSGAPSQVLVDRESRRRARIRPAIAARVGRRGGQFYGSLLSFSAQTKGTVRLVNAFYVTYGPQTIDFAIFVSMNPPTIRINRVVCRTGRHQLDADGCVTMVSDSRVS